MRRDPTTPAPATTTRCRRRLALRRATPRALLPLLWLAATAAPPAGDGTEVTSPARPLPAPGPTPAAAVWLVADHADGWVAVRDPRTGELVALAPGEQDRLDAGRLSSARAAAAVPVESRLPNGAVQIELPESLASPLYGWIDAQGALRTGHEPPPATKERGARGPGSRR